MLDPKSPRLTDIQEFLSRMHSLRHDVRCRLHRAGLDELDEWQKLEPETIEIDLNGPHAMCDAPESLQRIVARLTKLRSSIA